MADHRARYRLEGLRPEDQAVGGAAEARRGSASIVKHVPMSEGHVGWAKAPGAAEGKMHLLARLCPRRPTLPVLSNCAGPRGQRRKQNHANTATPRPPLPTLPVTPV